MLGKKILKFKNTEIILSMFFDHNGITIEINYKEKKPGKYQKLWRLNNMLLNNSSGAKKQSKEKLKTILDKWNKIAYQNLRDTVKAVLRGKCLAKMSTLKKTNKKTKNSNRLPIFTTLYLKELKKEEKKLNSKSVELRKQ